MSIVAHNKPQLVIMKILIASEKPLYGAAIMKRSVGVVKTSSLYTSLKKLLEKGWIKKVKVNEKTIINSVYYVPTDIGKVIFESICGYTDDEEINLRRELSTFLKNKRTKKGLPLRDITKITSVPESTYTLFERGEGIIPEKLANKLIEVLNLTTEEIIYFDTLIACLSVIKLSKA